MGFKAKKLVNYIRNDRLSRFKAYIDKYGTSITKLPLDDKGRTALHIACCHSSIYCFAYLLKLKPNLMKTDSDGNLPLHWALSAAKKGQHYAYTDIVLPLLKLCRGAQDVPNKNGLTSKQILVELGLGDENTKRPVENKGSYNDYESSDDEDDYKNDNDDKRDFWNQRLREELDDDCADSWGRYGSYYDNDDDDDNASDREETYDDWTRRIASEYSTKYRRRSSGNNNSSSNSTEERNKKETSSASSSWSREDQANFENECRKQDTKRMDILEALSRTRLKSQFSAKYNRIFDTKNPKSSVSVIHLEDLPFSNCGTRTSNEIIAILLADVDPSDFAAKKKCLREQQVQWHPDKFLQKCGNRVAEEDREEIIAAVNHFSQIVNVALDDICNEEREN